jgi:membrane associated rhomboid family serine protease
MLRLTQVVKNLLIINVAVFFLQLMFTQETAIYGALWDVRHEFWKPTQFVTHMFMHGDTMHLLFNMLGLLFLGPAVESVLGDRKFLLFYMVCGVGAGLIHGAATYFEYPDLMVNAIPRTVGASGAISGILMAAALYFPNAEVIMFPIPIPIKIKYLVLFLVVYELFTGLGVLGDFRGTNIANFAHFGGFLIGYIFLKVGNFNFKNRH